MEERPPVSMTKTGIGYFVSAPDGLPYAGRSFAKLADAQRQYAEWRRIERGACASCGDETADAQRHVCESSTPDVCRYCGHARDRHDVAAPSTDNWRICYDCPSYSHVFEAVRSL